MDTRHKLNFMGEWLQRRPRRTRRVCWWQPGHGWQCEQDFPARPVKDIASLRRDLAWLALSYPVVGFYDSGQRSYTAVMVLFDRTGEVARPVFVGRLNPGSDEPP